MKEREGQVQSQQPAFNALRRAEMQERGVGRGKQFKLAGRISIRRRKYDVSADLWTFSSWEQPKKEKM